MQGSDDQTPASLQKIDQRAVALNPGKPGALFNAGTGSGSAGRFRTKQSLAARQLLITGPEDFLQLVDGLFVLPLTHDLLGQQ